MRNVTVLSGIISGDRNFTKGAPPGCAMAALVSKVAASTNLYIVGYIFMVFRLDSK
jgi:hypothetical protein